MSSLKLVTTENFGNISCDFYRNMNDDILLTREQIGTALEYVDPGKAIRKIHLKHKDRLEPLCVRIKLSGHPQSGATLTNEEKTRKSLLYRTWNHGDMQMVPTKESKPIHGLVLGCNREIPK